MLRSTCADRLAAAAAMVAVIAAATIPARAADEVVARPRPAYAFSRAKSPIPRDESDAGATAPAGRSAARTSRATTPKRQTGVVTTNYLQDQLTEPMPELGSKPKKFVKPFRKIADILPYDTYDPISTSAERERCPTNLCPCPEGAECPECCPDEDSLRRLGREKGEPDRPFIARNFAHMYYSWEPTNMYHNPIYFEDVALERYGHTRHFLIQPVFSGAKFALQFFGLPYQMTLYPFCSRQYSLGYYRPGECAPYKYYQIPLNAEAALVEAGVITGGYFLFAPGVGP
jgi:hypothetical protein